MRLYLVRHAKAEPGNPDELRRLSADGREQARALGERLAALPEPPDAVLSSPLLRARETAAAIARALGLEERTDDRLAPGALADDVVEAAAEAGGRVVVVGHQPDCSEIVEALTGTAAEFPPGGVAEIEVA